MKEINFCFTYNPNPEPPRRINATELNAILSQAGALLLTFSKSSNDSKVKKDRFDTMANVKSEL
jgi:hypothetical protein